MTLEQTILEDIKDLPENIKLEAANYIQFLKSKYSTIRNKKEVKREFGSSKANYKLSDDFDEPLIDFKEYM